MAEKDADDAGIISRRLSQKKDADNAEIMTLNII
jgi:hypothetical protein